MSTMPLTVSRPKAAKILGWSLDEMQKQTESGKVAVVWTGKRRKVTAGEIARVAGVTVDEVADRYTALFPDKKRSASVDAA